MPIPTYGAGPLSQTFLYVRVLQVISMISVVGMTANFISMIVSSGIAPPKEFVGTLSITCIATLYSLVSIAFYWSEAHLGLFVMAGADGMLLIAFIVVAVTVGKPLSFLNCAIIPSGGKSADAAGAYAFTASVVQNLNTYGNSVTLAPWAGATKANCYETKAIWGLSIALCLLFTTSCILLPTLFYKNKKAAPKSVDV